MAIVSDFPNCCGIKVIHSLNENDDLDAQIELIQCRIKDNAMLVLTDVIGGYEDGSKSWAETKSIADRGVIKTNPNSGNRIAMWTILPKHLKELKALRKKQNGKRKKRIAGL